MANQISKPALWLRLGGVILGPLLLVLAAILVLPTEPVQAERLQPAAVAAASPVNVPHYAPGKPALTITVEATSTTVVPGQTITYHIQFDHTGGTSPLHAQLLNCIPKATLPHIDGLVVQETGTVTGTSPQFSYSAICDNLANFDGAGIRWQGRLAPDSTLHIRYTTQVEPCYDPNPVTLRSRVGVQGDRGNLTASALIEVDCLPAVDPAKIDVDLSFFGSDGGLADGTDNIFGPGKSYYQISLRNSDTNPTVLGLFGVFPSRSFNIGMPPTLQREANFVGNTFPIKRAATLDHAPTLHPDSNVLRNSQAETQTTGFLVPLAAGETKIISLPLKLAKDVDPESEFRARLGYCITYDGLTCPDPVVSSFRRLPPVSFTVRYRDLGDAADSTNHFSGATMTAYPGITGTFPTVFDPATGPGQGPAHLRPRPFHLGRKVTPEAEADIGPDLDPSNNIRPLGNVANRDRRDDGLAVHLLNFNHCQTSLVPVRIMIRPAAVAYFQQTNSQGYLNLWLDGNHDGDWDDSVPCQEQTAIEHIVIDHMIDVVGLGAGVHTVPVPTGLVPWSGQAAWLRATLSEQPANKTLNAAGIDYGDGRGYSAPFQLGETEDHLLSPTGTKGAGPDMAVYLRTNWRPEPDLAQIQPKAALAPDLEIHLTASYFKIEYRNEGSEAAKNVFLKHRIPPALQDIDPKITTLPKLAAAQISQQPGLINISLGEIGPKIGGSIILSWQGCLTCIRRNSLPSFVQYSGTTTIESSNDIDPGNNQADAILDVPGLLEFGFASPEGPYKFSGNPIVTCRNDIEIRGRTSPNTSLNIFSGGLGNDHIIATVTSDADGVFKQLINLPNGRHYLLVRFQEDNRARTIEKVDMVTTHDDWIEFRVNNNLLWNPSSLFFSDSQGRIVAQPAGAGFLGAWRELTLRSGESYQMGLEYCGSDPTPTIQAVFEQIVLPLSDADGDGIYLSDVGALTLPAAQRAIAATYPLTLSIDSSSVELAISGDIQTSPAGVVYDSGSGEVVSATVALLSAINGDSNIGFDIWPGADYGQTNPYLTGNNGAYTFGPQAGTYRLAANRSGYQPYHSWDVQTTGEPVTINLPLTPEVTDEATYIIEVSADGFEPSLLTIPPGSIVQWVNTDIDEHTSASTGPVVAGPGEANSGGWDSGVLSSGERYTLQFNTEGTFTYADQADPGNTAQIVVDGNAGRPVYLPLVIR